jgi:hypothetical protein
MATKRKPRQWMIDDPNVPESVGPQDLLVRLPSGDKVSVRSVFWAALHVAREKKAVGSPRSSMTPTSTTKTRNHA